MKLNKVIFVLIIQASILLPILNVTVIAAANKITCSTNDCSNNRLELFSNSRNWYPGKWETDYLQIENKGKYPIIITFLTSDNQTDQSNCKLDNKLQMSIAQLSQTGIDQIIWGGSLSDFKNAKEIKTKEISENKTEKFRFLISLDQQTGNECQGTKTSLNLKIQIQAKTTDQTTTCQTEKPTAPILKSAYWINNDYIHLKWQNNDDNTNYFIISYTDEYNKQSIISNAGTKSATEYNFFPTTKSTVYRFSVYAGSNCALSEPSNILEVGSKPTSNTINTTTQQQKENSSIQPNKTTNNNLTDENTTPAKAENIQKNNEKNNNAREANNSIPKNKTQNKPTNKYIQQVQITATELTAQTVKTVISIIKPIIVIVVSVVSSILSILK